MWVCLLAHRCHRWSEARDQLKVQLHEILSHPLWMLGLRLRSSGKADCILNHWAIFPTPNLHFWGYEAGWEVVRLWASRCPIYPIIRNYTGPQMLPPKLPGQACTRGSTHLPTRGKVVQCTPCCRERCRTFSCVWLSWVSISSLVPQSFPCFTWRLISHLFFMPLSRVSSMGL